MHETDDAADALDLAAADFAERCRRGERPSIAEYIEQYPDLADDTKLLLDIYEGNVDTIEFVSLPVAIQ